MTSSTKMIVIALAAALAACGSATRAEMPESPAPAGAAAAAPEAAANPVAHVRQARSWEYGPFVNGGFGVGDRSDFKFLSAGFQVGKPLSRVIHAGPLSGQFEFSSNIMPLWQAYTPSHHEKNYTCPGGGSCPEPVGGGTYRGVGMTPVILRWNLLTSSHKVQPWFQGAGGLIYTTHKFPPDILVPHGKEGGTSVWNFAPQGGFGIHYFTRPGRSIDLGLNAVHISSASLGDRNPGVNASLQIQVGYTFWK
ncbi:MAG: acyloxyacyl hydrolase [Terracidiphilus sp.]